MHSRPLEAEQIDLNQVQNWLTNYVRPSLQQPLEETAYQTTFLKVDLENGEQMHIPLPQGAFSYLYNLMMGNRPQPESGNVRYEEISLEFKCIKGTNDNWLFIVQDQAAPSNSQVFDILGRDPAEGDAQAFGALLNYYQQQGVMDPTLNHLIEVAGTPTFGLSGVLKFNLKYSNNRININNIQVQAAQALQIVDGAVRPAVIRGLQMGGVVAQIMGELGGGGIILAGELLGRGAHAAQAAGQLLDLRGLEIIGRGMRHLGGAAEAAGNVVHQAGQEVADVLNAAAVGINLNDPLCQKLEFCRRWFQVNPLNNEHLKEKGLALYRYLTSQLLFANAPHSTQHTKLTRIINNMHEVVTSCDEIAKASPQTDLTPHITKLSFAITAMDQEACEKNIKKRALIKGFVAAAATAVTIAVTTAITVGFLFNPITWPIVGAIAGIAVVGGLLGWLAGKFTYQYQLHKHWGEEQKAISNFAKASRQQLTLFGGSGTAQPPALPQALPEVRIV